DVPASKQLGEIRRSVNWELSKVNIFGGFDSKELIQKLEDYLENGSVNDLSKEETVYLDALTLFNSIYRKYGRRRSVQFFTKPPFGLTWSRASEMCDEAINLFYIDRNVQRQAIRTLYAEQLDEA